MVGNFFDKFYQILAVVVTLFTVHYIKANEQWPTLVYLFVINAWTIVLYYEDKCNSKNSKRWRTSENCLIWTSLLGGWIGAIFAQQCFRHKIRKWTFQFQFFISIVINMYMIYLRNDIYAYISDKIVSAWFVLSIFIWKCLQRKNFEKQSKIFEYDLNILIKTDFSIKRKK